MRLLIVGVVWWMPKRATLASATNTLDAALNFMSGLVSRVGRLVG